MKLTRLAAAVIMATGLAACSTAEPLPNPGIGRPTSPLPSIFPTPVNTALAFLASRTRVPLEGPTILPTNPLSPTYHPPESATATASPDKYFVQLDGCAKAYPLNSPALKGPNCSGLAQDFGDFGGQSFASPSTAEEALSKVGFGPGSVAAACSTGASHSVKLADGITGRVLVTASTACLAWTQGGWTFYICGAPTAAELPAAARSLVAYVHTHLLPGTDGIMNEDAGGDGQHTTTAWTVGDDDYTAGNYHSALGALQLAFSMRLASYTSAGARIASLGQHGATTLKPSAFAVADQGRQVLAEGRCRRQVDGIQRT